MFFFGVVTVSTGRFHFVELIETEVDQQWGVFWELFRRTEGFGNHFESSFDAESFPITGESFQERFEVSSLVIVLQKEAIQNSPRVAAGFRSSSSVGALPKNISHLEGPEERPSLDWLREKASSGVPPRQAVRAGFETWWMARGGRRKLAQLGRFLPPL